MKPAVSPNPLTNAKTTTMIMTAVDNHLNGAVADEARIEAGAEGGHQGGRSNGNTDDKKDGKDGKEQKADVTCYRCGRPGHIKPDCHAKYHVDGTKLSPQANKPTRLGAAKDTSKDKDSDDNEDQE